MTQTAPQPAPPASPPGKRRATTPARTSSSGAAADDGRDLTEDVPRLLGRLQGAAVAVCLAFAVVAVVVQVLSWQANGRAADNTEQVVRVQQIQSLLLRADAVATNSYLSGGLEPADARAEYDQAVDDVLRLIADAAEAQPADREALADLNATVSQYTTSVAQARELNRQDKTIGIAYVNDAGRTLRGTAQPIVAALVDANTDRAEGELDGQHPWWLLGVGVIALFALHLLNRALARRFHRRVNLGLAAAAVAIGFLTLVTTAHALIESIGNGETRDGAYRTAIDEATARTAANDAKANESRGLINRGAGTTVYEPLWDAQAEMVDELATPETLGLWQQYVAAHDAVRERDDRGEWAAAVQLAVDRQDGSATALLDAFDAQAADVVAAEGAEAADGFRGGGTISVVLIVLTALGGLGAAGAAARGIDQRRKEYA
ncbi:hypothetical protein GCM10023340_28220 [Nocardioides marinquilinus]|uniref:Uncharacterized protein n=1 Tax=Nocardioides marinquilinus TaxID=1210400 RepID=A0ABP9PRY6_9ACTN